MTNEYIRKADAIDDLHTQLMYRMGSDDIKRRLDDWVKTLPSADVAPVVHAYWIDTDNYYRRWRCSACSGHTKEAHPPFCPFCGAKMDGEEREHEQSKRNQRTVVADKTADW